MYRTLTFVGTKIDDKYICFIYSIAVHGGRQAVDAHARSFSAVRLEDINDCTAATQQ